MRATATLLIGSMAWGLSLFSTTMLASAPIHSWSMSTGSFLVGQISSDDNFEEASKFLRLARQAMRQKDYPRAEYYLSKAEKLDNNYDPLFAKLQDTPARVRANLIALQRGNAASSIFAEKKTTQSSSNTAQQSDRTAAPNDPFSRGRNNAKTDLLTNDNKAKATGFLNKGREAVLRRDAAGASYWYQRAIAERAQFRPHEYSPEKLSAELRKLGVDTSRLAPAPGSTPKQSTFRPSDFATSPVNRLPAALEGLPSDTSQNRGFSARVVSNPFTISPQNNKRLQQTQRASAFPGSATSLDTSSLSSPFRRDDSESLMRDARIALAQRDSSKAASLVAKAKQLGLTYPLHSDSPDKVEALIQKYNQTASAPKPGANRNQHSRDYALMLMEQADGLLRYKQFDQAESLAKQAQAMPVRYGQFQRTPTKLLNQIASKRAFDRITPGISSNASSGSSNKFDMPAKLKAQQFVAQARAAMDRGDIETADQLVSQAEALRVPNEAYEPGETRPWALRLEIERTMNRRKMATSQASYNNPISKKAGNTSNPQVQQGLYRPSTDNTRNIAAGVQQTISARRLPPEIDSQTSKGQQFIERGKKALEEQNADQALKYFRQAWAYQDQFDLQTQRFLSEKLNLLSAPATIQLAQRETAIPLNSAQTEQQILQQKLFREVTAEQASADRLRASDPRGALDRLQRLRQRVAESKLDPANLKQLLTVVDRNINETERFIEVNLADIENKEINQARLASVDRDRKIRLEIQNKLAELVEQFNTLMDEERYAEAEVLAQQARDLAPEEAVVQNLIWKSRFVRRLQEQMTIRDQAEQGFYDTMSSVGKSKIPFDDNNPFQFGPVREWHDLTLKRKKYLQGHRTRLSPAEQAIQKALKIKVEASFNGSPLSEVMDILGRKSGVNIYLDPQGMRAEGVGSDTPITINLTQPISIRSVLNLILQPLRLSYVIQDEVLRITSEQTRDTDVYHLVYDVADLVIPIPNFVPSYNVGLPSALQQAHNSLGYGNAPTVGVGPLTIAGNNPAANTNINPSIMAFQNGNSMLSRARPVKSAGFGPGGLGGGVQADFDSLIDLITSTIAPDSWDEAGGPGTISGFDTNLSLVVSTTQEVHEELTDLLEQLRRLQDLQVTIEVRFITLNDNFFERIGIDFDFQIDDNTGPLPADDFGPSTVVGLQAGPTGFSSPLDPLLDLTTDRDLVFNQGSFGSAIPAFGGFDVNTAANFGFAILSDIEVFFLLQAAQGDQRTNVMQAPKVTLFNGQLASVSDTSQMPFVTSIIPVVGDFAVAHQPVVIVLSEGTTLSVQAVVSQDRRFVRLTLVPFFSKIGNVQEFTFTGKTTTNSGTNVLDATGSSFLGTNNVSTTTEGTTIQLPTFAFTTVNTTVNVPDGGTVLMGGIKRLSEGRSERGVPMLNKLPYINRLFKNVGIGRTTQSLMMMVTPRIIIQEEEEERAVGHPLE